MKGLSRALVVVCGAAVICVSTLGRVRADAIPLSVLFDDSFVDNRFGWTTDGGWRNFFEASGFHIVPERTGDGAIFGVTSRNIPSVRNVTVQATLSYAGGPEGGSYGVSVRSSAETRSNYALLLTHSGYVSLVRNSQTGPKSLLPWHHSPALRPADEPNTIQITAYDRVLGFWLNGHPIARLEDDDVPNAGAVHLRVSEGTHVVARRITVRLSSLDDVPDPVPFAIDGASPSPEQVVLCLPVGERRCLLTDQPLHGAVTALLGTGLGQSLLPGAAGFNVQVRLGDADGNAYAHFDGRKRLVIVDESLGAAPPAVVAALLAHELRHATDFYGGIMKFDAEGCYDAERRGWETEYGAWIELGAPAELASTGAYAQWLTSNAAWFVQDPDSFFEDLRRRYVNRCETQV